jgi:hypothetical protein
MPDQLPFALGHGPAQPGSVRFTPEELKYMADRDMLTPDDAGALHPDDLAVYKHFTIEGLRGADEGGLSGQNDQILTEALSGAALTGVGMGASQLLGKGAVHLPDVARKVWNATGDTILGAGGMALGQASGHPWLGWLLGHTAGSKMKFKPRAGGPPPGFKPPNRVPNGAPPPGGRPPRNKNLFRVGTDQIDNGDFPSQQGGLAPRPPAGPANLHRTGTLSDIVERTGRGGFIPHSGRPPRIAFDRPANGNGEDLAALIQQLLKDMQ